MELQNSGHIARILCGEVRCAMAYGKVIKNQNQRIRLCVRNPKKFRIYQFSIRYHERRNDQISVFSDNTLALKTYPTKLKKSYIYEKTPQSEQINILENFQHIPNINTIFVSKIADTSFDLLDANVLIRISSHGGSGRQEAQRLGRILRAKPGANVENNVAFFYYLISQDTIEMFYSAKPQTFLVNNQSNAYKIITGLELEGDNLFCLTEEERQELLHSALSATDRDENERESTRRPTRKSFSHRTF